MQPESLPPYPPRWLARARDRRAELARDWLVQSKRDLASARYLATGNRFEAACFACQQATDNLLATE